MLLNKGHLCGLIAAFGALWAGATELTDTTLRLDYIFGGTQAQPTVALSRLHKSAGWHGRTANLKHLALDGNGRVTMTDTTGRDTLYATSFSSLYNEWLTLGDSIARAYEHTVLVPMPTEPANVELVLTDNRRQPMARHTMRVDPADILIARMPERPLYDTVALHRGAWPGHKIQIAILPEGFTEARMSQFEEYARRTVDAILAHEPFATLADRIDFTAVEVPSADSGVSVPLEGRWSRTPFGSHFSTFNSDRYLTTPNVFAVHDALAGVPYEHIIILANTDVYGGGGIYNDYTLTTTGHKNFEPVVVHEFGHSFGGLGDEYFYEDDIMSDTYPLDVEPWEPNITTMVDFKSKWQGLVDSKTPVPTPRKKAPEYPIGVFEGGGYALHGVYSPADDCRMRTNTAQVFCPACQAWLSRLIIYYTE